MAIRRMVVLGSGGADVRTLRCLSEVLLPRTIPRLQGVNHTPQEDAYFLHGNMYCQALYIPTVRSSLLSRATYIITKPRDRGGNMRRRQSCLPSAFNASHREPQTLWNNRGPRVSRSEPQSVCIVTPTLPCFRGKTVFSPRFNTPTTIRF